MSNDGFAVRIPGFLGEIRDFTAEGFDFAWVQASFEDFCCGGLVVEEDCFLIHHVTDGVLISYLFDNGEVDDDDAYCSAVS